MNNSVISIDGKKIDETYINYMNNLVDNQFKISNLILQTNYYEKVFKPNDNYIKNSISEQID